MGIACVAQAQFPSAYTIGTKVQVCAGAFESVQPGNYAVYNRLYHDTLESGDTLVVIIPIYYPDRSGKTSTLNVPFSNNVYPEIIEYWKKAGTTDTIVDVTFWQSMDGAISTVAKNKTVRYSDGTTGTITLPAPILTAPVWKQIKNTTTPTVYAAAETVTTGATAEYDFHAGIFYVTGRYIAVRYIARAKSGFKYCPTFAVRILAH